MTTFPPFMFSYGLFRSLAGDAFIFEKEIGNEGEYKSLLHFLSRKRYVTHDGSDIIYENTTGIPTYFLRYDPEKSTVELKVSKKRGFAFVVSDEVENVKNVFESFGFKFKGNGKIDNKMFQSEYDYPKFSQSKGLLMVWLLLTLTAIPLSKMIAGGDYSSINSLSSSANAYYIVINAFLKENVLVTLAVGSLFTLLISNTGWLKAHLKDIPEYFRKL
ncbi:hypothetical protein [Methanococcoides alaskense]|uniref:Uncharacterized protein n=1 Tax=Methanococcoides alaskense TaxID=325778 RepID=A0AA90U299_9EURY|nr:hypothetical protein [Methanococcoides alaskense]MDA0524339.1 hypothetical protein [Methanococcoides alaskense]MDR6223934.1 hypothetical protein [Methanococcoides alaskense]